MTGSYRSDAIEAQYETFKQKYQGVCTFCLLNKNTENQVISASADMFLIRNLFPYERWDGNPVSDHLMIVPRRHIVSLSELTPEESAQFVGLVGEYEDKGYSVYARASVNPLKTVIHQHTHLIRGK